MPSSGRSILVDAGPLIALWRRDDRDHPRAVAFARSTTAKLVTTWPVLTEVSHFLTQQSRLSLYTLIETGGLAVRELRVSEADRLREITQKYPHADLADASLVVLAERLKVHRVATLDERHFSAYRTKTGQASRTCFNPSPAGGVAPGAYCQIGLCADLRVGYPELKLGQPEIKPGSPASLGRISITRRGKTRGGV